MFVKVIIKHQVASFFETVIYSPPFFRSFNLQPPNVGLVAVRCH